MKMLPKMSAIAVFIATSVPAFAQDPAPKPCEPQPTCEFSNLIIKPGAPTPGVKSQGTISSGIEVQSREPSDLRNSYRLPTDSAGGVRLAK